MWQQAFTKSDKNKKSKSETYSTYNLSLYFNDHQIRDHITIYKLQPVNNCNFLGILRGMDVDNFYCIVHCEISSRENYSIEKKSLKILKKLHQWMGQRQVLLCSDTPPRASDPPSLEPVCKNSTGKIENKFMKLKVKK